MMHPNFKKKDLKNYAGSAVFNRGVNYFREEAVSEIKAVSDKYTAKVYGGSIYTAEYSPYQNRFSCNCPYDGFCKHLVAFGLKLLNEKDQLPPTMNFEDWFEDIDDEVKLGFLKRLVHKDITLREKLDKMSRKDNQTIDITNISGAVYNSLNALSYEDVLENHYDYNHYADEYEVIDDLISETLNDFLMDAEELMQAGKPEEAFDYILGIHLGLVKSDETEINEYLDDFESFLYDTIAAFVGLLKQQPPELKFKILNSFIVYCKTNGIKHFAIFYAFLSSFVIEKHSEILKKFLIAYSRDYTAKKILMQIAGQDQDVGLMENLLENNDSVSLYVPYLDLLKKKNDFDKIKHIVLKFSGSNDLCLLEKFVLPELGVSTYKKLLLKLIESCIKPEYYKKYKSLLTGDEKQRFLANIQKNISYSTERYALPILFSEKMYEPVLKTIEKYATSEWGFESFKKYLKKIAKTMPGPVWEIYAKHTEFLFAKRKRDAYASMTHNLKIMLKTDHEKTEQLIRLYYNHTPVLRALKDEFNKAGII